MKTGIKIVSAKYLTGYKIEILFSDGKKNVFDYESLVMSGHDECKPYRDVKKFKQFKIIDGTEIAWGDDWNMILPLFTIYSKQNAD